MSSIFVTQAHVLHSLQDDYTTNFTNFSIHSEFSKIKGAYKNPSDVNLNINKIHRQNFSKYVSPTLKAKSIIEQEIKG